MSTLKSVATKFLNKNKPDVPLAIQPHPTNAFRSIFDIQQLDESESRQIEKLLVENFRPGSLAEEKVQSDVSDLKNITAEVKSIRKQGVLLLGERLYKAREILKNYGDGKGTFTQWLKLTFNSRATGYNALAYYEFYHSIDERLRDQLKQMPYKAAYVLASREGDLSVKADIVREYYQEKADDIIPIIQEKLPVSEDARRRSKDVDTVLIDRLEAGVRRLVKRYDSLSAMNRQRLQEIAKKIDVASLVEVPEEI